MRALFLTLAFCGLLGGACSEDDAGDGGEGGDGVTTTASGDGGDESAQRAGEPPDIDCPGEGDNARAKFDLAVWFEVDVPDDAVESVRGDLEAESSVDEIDYFDTEASYAEFREPYADDGIDTDPDSLPTSFRVVIDPGASWDVVTDLGDGFESRAEVRAVTYPSATELACEEAS